MRTRGGFIAALALGAVLVAPVMAAPNSSTSQFGYPWRGRVPVTITIADYSGVMRPFVEQAAADWSLSPVLDVVVVRKTGVCSLKSKATICEGAYGLDANHTGWMVYSSQNGYMTDATVYLNDSYLLGWTNVDGVVFPPYTPEQRAHIACHEMGHMLGILAEGGCSENTSWQERPTQTDYDRLLDIYGG